MLAITAVFLILCLGLTLHWNGEPVRMTGLRPLNLLLWRLGHTLKPGFFVEGQPPEWNMDTIPLPAMVLAVVVPFFERGRALARYALPAGLGVFLLAGLVLSRVRFRWLQVFLGVLLVFEIVPPRLETVPFPSPTHPAFEWLKQQPMDGQGILDAYSGNPSTLVMGIGGEACWRLATTANLRRPARPVSSLGTPFFSRTGWPRISTPSGSLTSPR